MSALLAGRQRKALAASYFAFYAVLGLMVPYLSVYLDHLGFDSKEIGWLLSLIFASRIIAPNLWAALADKLGKPVMVIRAGATIAALGYLGFLAVDTFWLLALVIGFYTFFWNGILAQIEVVTLSTLADKPEDYGSLRSFGSIGFIVMVTGAGWWFGQFGPADLPLFGLAMFVALLLASFSLTEVAPRQNSEQQVKASFLQQISQKPVLCFLFAMLVLQASHGPFYTFYVLYLKDLGINEGSAGLLVSLGVVAEIGIFLLAPRLIGRYSVRRLMIACCVLTALRWGITNMAGDNIALHGFAQLLHAFSFGLSHACGIQFVHQHISAEHQGKAQAFYASTSFGIGGMIGAYASGMLWQNGVGASLTWTAATMAAIAATIFAIWMGKKPQ